MTTNINRYAYTDFSAMPYTYYHGVPCAKIMTEPKYQDNQRTIIRTNQPHRNQKIISSAESKKVHPSIEDGSWSNSVRKDNLYERYSCNCK